MKVYAIIPKGNEETKVYKEGEVYSGVKGCHSVNEATREALETINARMTILRLTAHNYMFDKDNVNRGNDREYLISTLDRYRKSVPYFLAEFEWNGDSGTLLSIQPWQPFVLIGGLFDDAYESLKHGDGSDMSADINTATYVTVYELSKLRHPIGGDIDE